MTRTLRTHIVSVHAFRRVARHQERELQRWLEFTRTAGDGHLEARLEARDLPAWVRGVRVEKAGRFQWAVVATEKVGR